MNQMRQRLFCIDFNCPNMLVLDWGWIESIASKTSHWLKNSSHFHLETTVCTATKESIVTRVVARGAFAVGLLLEPTVVVPDISGLSRSPSVLYIVFKKIYGKCKLPQCVGFPPLKPGGWEFNSRWEPGQVNFFSFLFPPPTCSFLI